MPKIAPSLLSADFSKLGEEILSVKNADYLHYDAMDGVFVPNISIGIPVLSSIRKITDKIIDVHLMIVNPLKHIRSFSDAGADVIVIHLEENSPDDVIKAIDLIKSLGKKAGISLKPDTVLSKVLPLMPKLDQLMIMTVEPGMAGQSFMHNCVAKIKEARAVIDKNGYECKLEVDGGINLETGKIAVGAGADILVSGNFIFLADDREKIIFELQNLK